MYTYKALINRVVDGDTYDAIVDLGFGISMKQRIRLYKIDTPETWRPKTNAERLHGEMATKFVTNLILNKEVYLKSHKQGKYGRYLADILIDDKDLGTLIQENNLVKLESYSDGV